MNRRLLTAEWVLPVTSPPLQAAGVLIGADGRIEAVGPAAALRNESIEEIALGAAAILPGLVNVHAHPELAAFRGLLDDLPFHLWIPTLMRCKREAQLTDADYAACAEWTLVESLRAGITTVGATESSGAALPALVCSGMRGLVYLEIFGPDPDQAANSMADLRQRLARLAPLANDRVRLGVSPHAPYTVSDPLFSAVAQYAQAESLPVATHAAEAEVEELLVTAGTGAFAAGLRARGIATPRRGRSTIDLLHRVGLLGVKPLLIHCVRINAADLQLIADHGAAIAHCPVANARLGHGIAPVVEARAAGVTVALGTDSVASNNRLDLLEEARIAQIAQRARLTAGSVLAAEELLRLVTIDGARALGLAQNIGSLEPGKDADLCVVGLTGAHTVPAPYVVNTLFHAARGSDVRMTMVQGKVLYDGATVTTLDELALHPRIVGIARRLSRVRMQPE